MKKTVKAFSFIFACLFLLLAVPFSAFAVGGANPMEHTEVVDDLIAMGFDIANYPKDSSADFVSIITFLEYGYDAGGDQRYYGLYVYLYNPSEKDISADGNMLQMSYRQGNGIDSKWIKYGLELISVSEADDYANRFYKFKVSATEDVGRFIQQGVRIYNLSGIELLYMDGSIKEHTLAQEWRYEGFQKNFGSSTGTLFSSCEKEEVVSIDLRNAYWFSKTSDLGESFRYQVSSVYFAIPDYFINEYGDPLNKNSDTCGLYSVEGEYRKYLTNVLAIGSEDCMHLYEPLMGIDMRKVPLSGRLPNGHIVSGPEFIKYGIANMGRFVTGYGCDWNWSFTKQSDVKALASVVYDKDGTFSQKEFLEIYNSCGKNRYLDPTTLVTGYLFENLGYNQFNISVDDEKLNDSIKSFAEGKYGKDFIYKLFNKDLWVDENGYPDCEPIVEITDFPFADFALNDEALSEHLFISGEDISNIRNYVDSYGKNNHIYLMRFDVNPYFSCEADLYSTVDSELVKDVYATYTETVVYENFDILTFSFKNEKSNVVTVPVSCSPTIIVGGIVSGNNKVDNDPNGVVSDINNNNYGLGDLSPLAMMLALLLFVGLFVLVIVVLAKAGVPVGAIVSSIGRGIGSVFRGIGKAAGAVWHAGGDAINFIDSRIDRKQRRIQNARDESRRDRLDAEDKRRWESESSRRDRDESRRDRLDAEDRVRRDDAEKRQKRLDKEDKRRWESENARRDRDDIRRQEVHDHNKTFWKENKD